MRCRSFTHCTWLARHGFATKDGPLVRPSTTKRALLAGIGRPSVRFSGMPRPLGHCGQLTSAPKGRPPFAGVVTDVFGVWLRSGRGGTASPLPSVAVAVVGVVRVGALEVGNGRSLGRADGSRPDVAGVWLPHAASTTIAITATASAATTLV